MEHICHFPCSFCRISLNCMCQCIHTGRCSQSFWHGRHHFRIDNRNDRHIMRIYAYKFTFSLYVCDNVIDRNLRRCTCCRRNCDDRYTRVLCRCHTFETSHILKFRICDNNADRFGSIHRRTASNCDQIICAGIFKRLNTMLYIFDGRIWFNI